ncbi:MAG: 50S ribosomal protein L25 [Microgenomates group bacterium]
MKTSQKDKLFLKVEPRTIFGRKLKRLRANGIIPANIYGPEFKSQAISVNFKDFIKVYKIAKETGVVYLDLEEKEIPVLIKNLQKHPVNGGILHIDFIKIDLTKKVQTEVPIKIVGESKAVKELGGILLTQTDSLLIEALPQDIPPAIEVNISSLKEIGQEIKVADLLKTNTFEIKSPPDKVIVSVIAHKEESVTPETTMAAPEVISEAKPEEKTSSPTEEKAAQTTSRE